MTAEPCAADDLDDGRTVRQGRLREDVVDDVERLADSEGHAKEIDGQPHDGQNEEPHGEVAATHGIEHEARERCDEQYAHDPDNHVASPLYIEWNRQAIAVSIVTSMYCVPISFIGYVNR